VAATAWRISGRVKIPSGVSGANRVVFGTFGGGQIGIGNLNTLDNTKIYRFATTQNVSGNAAPLGGEYTEMGTCPADWAQLDIESDGANNLRYRYNGGAWTAWLASTWSASGSSGHLAGALTFGSGMTVDWVFFARKVR
jgi:hypothetical protein